MESDNLVISLNEAFELLGAASPTARTRGAARLGELANESTAGGQEVIDAGALSSLIGMLSSGKGSDAECAALALARVSQGGSGLAERVAEEGAVGPLVGLLSSRKGSEAGTAAHALDLVLQGLPDAHLEVHINPPAIVESLARLAKGGASETSCRASACLHRIASISNEWSEAVTEAKAH